MVRWFVSKGWHGWVALLVLVVAFDLTATALGGETMTDSVRRWFHHRPTQWIVVPVMLYLVVHLTVIPWRFDPLDRTYVWLRNRVHTRQPVTQQPSDHYQGGQG
jgi:hypothetical protein